MAETGPESEREDRHGEEEWHCDQAAELRIARVAEGAEVDRPCRRHGVADRMAGASGYNGWLLERARPFLGEHVLDAGAGIGTFTSLLVAEGRAVVALETDPVRGAAAKPLAGSVVVVEGDATNADLDSRFDSVVCFNVLEHIRTMWRRSSGSARCCGPAAVCSSSSLRTRRSTARSTGSSATSADTR